MICRILRSRYCI